jgi:oligopeptide transport system substrate-binding protein
MRWIYTILLSVLFASGCHKRLRPVDEKRQHVRLNIHTEPPTLDARKATDTSSIGLISMCYEGLMKRNKNGGIRPAIAQNIEISEDGTLYTFHLRNAKWSDGKQVTAYDFEHTWKTVLNPSFPSGFSHDLYILKNGWAVKNREAPDDALGV